MMHIFKFIIHFLRLLLYIFYLNSNIELSTAPVHFELSRMYIVVMMAHTLSDSELVHGL